MNSCRMPAAAAAVVFLVVLAAAVHARAGGVESQALPFETHCFDLDAGAVHESCRESAADPADWDLFVAWNADREHGAVVLQNADSGAEIAHLAGADFQAVTETDVESASFQSSWIDGPFAPSVVILVRTDRGAVFKLRHAGESEASLTFDYALVVPEPE